jgi:hypothetical protein
MPTGFTKRTQLSPASEATILIAIFIFTFIPILLRRIFLYTLTFSDVAYLLALSAIWGLLVYVRYSHRHRRQMREEHIKEMIDEELIHRMK